MLNDTSVRILASIGVTLHLVAPVLGWLIGSMRWPVASVVALNGVLTLGLMLVERPHLDWLPLTLLAIHLLAVGGGLWWLLSPSSPGAVLTWIGYALGLLWLVALLGFMLMFKLDRLW